MDFVKRKKWSILATLLFMVVLWLNYEPNTHPEAYQIDGFPLLKQPDQITCGPTSAAMVLDFYGYPVGTEAVKAVARTQWFTYKDEAIGMSSPSLILRTLNHFDVPSKMFRTDIDRVKYLVSQRRPPILLVRSGWKTWHYVVAVGFDEDHVTLADPGYGELRTISIKTLENAWSFDSDLRGTEFQGHDYWRLLLESADIKGWTLIVPKQPVDRR